MNRHFNESNLDNQTPIWSNATVTPIVTPKWTGVQKMIKHEFKRTFSSEEALDQFLQENPSYEIQQRFRFLEDGSGKPKVSLIERAYAVTEVNGGGYRVPKRWLSDEEVTEYLKDPTK